MGFQAGVKRTLQLYRLHSAPLETVPALVAALLATGGELTVSVVVWGVYGLAYHAAGYGHNSLSDWMLGYDKNDEYKQHHPLNSGMGVKRAQFLVLTALITALYIPISTILLGARVGMAVVLAAGVVLGVLYNTLGKTTMLKPLPISFAHSTTFLLPYMAIAGIDMVALLGTATVFVWVFYQIAVSGEIMGITQSNETNLLRESGAEVEDMPDLPSRSVEYVLIISKRVQHGAMALRLSIGVLCMALCVYLGGSYVLILWILVLTAISMAQSWTITESGPYKRKEKSQLIVIIEFMSMLSLLTAAVPVITVPGALVLAVGSLVWAVALNLYQWGTVLRPDV